MCAGWTLVYMIAALDYITQLSILACQHADEHVQVCQADTVTEAHTVGSCVDMQNIIIS